MEILFEDCLRSEKIFDETFLEKCKIGSVFSDPNMENIKILIQNYTQKLEENEDTLWIVSLLFCWMVHFHKKYIHFDEIIVLLENVSGSSIDIIEEEIYYEKYNNVLKNFDFFIENVDEKFMEDIIHFINGQTNFLTSMAYPFILLCIKNHKNNVLKIIIGGVYSLDDIIDDIELDNYPLIFNNDRTFFEILLTFSMSFKNYEICDCLIKIVDKVYLTDSFFECLIENGNYNHPFDILEICSNENLCALIIEFLYSILNKVEELVLNTKNGYLIHSFYIDMASIDKNFICKLNEYTSFAKKLLN